MINGQSLTIVGVAPRGFNGTTLGTDPSVFVPISMRGLMDPGWKGFDNRRCVLGVLFARLKPGTSIDQARATMNGVLPVDRERRGGPAAEGHSDATMARFKARQLIIEPGSRGQSSVHREARVPMIFLLAVTGIVLVIACANIANLLLARGAGRATEMAVRLSIGANRRHLMTQLLTESCVLAVLGGIASLSSRGGRSLISSLLPPEALRICSSTSHGHVVAVRSCLVARDRASLRPLPRAPQHQAGSRVRSRRRPGSRRARARRRGSGPRS